MNFSTYLDIWIGFCRIPDQNFGLRQFWMNIIRASRNEPEWFPNDNSAVCSIHFRPDEIVTVPGKPSSEATLNYDSGKNIVPSLHLDFADSNTSESTKSNKDMSTNISKTSTEESNSPWANLQNEGTTKSGLILRFI